MMGTPCTRINTVIRAKTDKEERAMMKKILPVDFSFKFFIFPLLSLWG
jgi:hypothetical protein